jgi:ribosomal protein S18 acetylase RimI-like enzyme
MVVRESFDEPDVSTLVRANEANLYALSPFFHDWPDARKYAGPDLSWCVTGIPFPWCNVAFGARLDPAHVDEAVEAFVAEGEKRNVPLFWWMGQESKPEDLGDYLGDYGFAPWGESTLMATDLYALKEGAANPRGLSIRQVGDRESLRTWCRTTAEGFGIQGSAGALVEWFEKGVDLGLPLLFYLGYLEGRPVATSLLFLAEGVAGIYFVATLPAVRCKGIGFSVTLEPLREARSMGYGVGILQASKAGVPIYRRMGFLEGCKMRSYVRMTGRR